MKRSLLVVAHGSRRKESNEEVRALAEKMSSAKHGFYVIKAAFLELAEPSIPGGIRELIQHGANEVVVLPYFLSAGRHVVKDIPADIEAIRQEYPDIKITIAPYLGAADGICELLFKQAGNNAI